MSTNTDVLKLRFIYNKCYRYCSWWYIYRWTAVIRYWNRILLFDNNRLTKLVFLYDYSNKRNNWCSGVKSIMNTLDLSHYYENKMPVDMSLAKGRVNDHYKRTWCTEVERFPKLRTYRLFKQEFKCEGYLLLNLPRNERSMLSQFRCGILPLRVETGRYVGEPIEERKCRLCTQNKIENEFHFLLECEHYSDARNNIFGNLLSELDRNNLFTHLPNNYTRKSAKYLTCAYMKRRDTLYKL